MSSAPAINVGMEQDITAALSLTRGSRHLVKKN